MTFLFSDELHAYFVDGEEYPSVSRIIEERFGVFWEPETEEEKLRLARACEFGSNVHTGIQLVLLGKLDWSTVDDALRPCIESAIKFVDQYNISFNINDVEKLLYSRKYKFAGTIDLIGTNKEGDRVIVDWKTSNSINLERIGYQLYGYDILDQENTIRKTKCNKYAVQLLLDGGFKVYPVKDVMYRQKFLTTLKEMREKK